MSAHDQIDGAAGADVPSPIVPALWTCRLDGREFDFDGAARHHLGLESAAPRYSLHDWIEVVHVDDRRRVRDAFDRMATSSGTVAVEFRTTPPHDRERWLALHGCSNERAAKDGAASVSGMLIDVSAYRTAAETLRAREEQIESIVSAVPAAMVVSDDHGLIISFNPVAERVFGYQAHEVIGRNVKLLMPPPDRDLHDDHLHRHRTGGAPRIIGEGRVVSGVRRDGSLFPMELSIGAAHVRGGLLYTAFIQDLTERHATEVRMRELQAELIHESRLSATGTMASMLAHEITQPLTAIANYVSAAADILDEPIDQVKEVLRDALREAAEQSIRAGEIIRRLRDFVTKGEVDKQAEPLARLIDEAVMLGLLGATKVEVRTDVDPALVVFVDRIQIQQIIVNLVRNAAEAMQATPAAAIFISAQPQDDDLIEICVRDTGPGLDRAIIDQLFQPFTSTKPHGLGLGLSICRTIVEAHGGQIKARRGDHGGTIIRFTLPASAEAGHED